MVYNKLPEIIFYLSICEKKWLAGVVAPRNSLVMWCSEGLLHLSGPNREYIYIDIIGIVMSLIPVSACEKQDSNLPTMTE